jgi:hypothetical protein
MPPGRLESSEQRALAEFVDAVRALSDEPTRANVERYLAESSALEHRPSPRTRGERSFNARPLPQFRP